MTVQMRFGAGRGKKNLYPDHGTTSVTDCCSRGMSASSAQKECGDDNEGVVPVGNDWWFEADMVVGPEGIDSRFMKGDNTLYAEGSMMTLWSLMGLAVSDQIMIPKYAEISRVIAYAGAVSATCRRNCLGLKC